MNNEQQALVMGAVYSFAAYLTTRDQTITAGRTHDAAPMAEAVKTWAEGRGMESVEPNLNALAAV